MAPKRLLVAALCTAALTVLPTVTAQAVPGGASTVFVNELHYDNTGTDAGEAVEVAGPAGTDLTGWSVVLYNGNGGGVYDTDPLTGSIPDQVDGWGTVWIGYPSNGVQNGSPDGLALVDPGGVVVQFLSYEGSFTAVGGPADGLTSTDIGRSETGSEPVGQSLQLTGTGLAAGDFAWSLPAPATFGQPNAGQVFAAPPPPTDPCTVPVTHEIGAVQGDGFRSPAVGTEVTVSGVVTADHQGADELGGFFLQDVDGDGSAATSDGIFVLAGAPDVAVGDLVRVTGPVQESFGLTRLAAADLGDCGDAAVPAPAPLDLPADDPARERLEGMLVTLVDTVTATETYDLARYGELLVSAEGRLYNPTNGTGTTEEANEARSLLLDDASDVENPDDIPFAEPGDVIRLGDTLTAVTGPLGYGFGSYRLYPLDEPPAADTNPRTAAPDPVGGTVQVASFNVLNYFTTVDDGSEYPRGEPRGADSVEELARQRAKIVAAMVALDADVLGLMEIENDEDDAAVDDLVTALNAELGAGTYAAVEEPVAGGTGPFGGTFGDDAIKVAMLYRPDVVRPLGDAMTTTDPAFANARLPLAQAFKPVGPGSVPFTVVVNHFKSKGCGDPAPPPGDPNADGPEGCFSADRVLQAGALLDLLDDVPTNRTLVIGDLNSYGEEAPISVLESAGLVDLVDTRLAEPDQYTYVFEGEAGYLDHALASPKLADRVTGVDVWHINADEPRFLDYNTEFNPPGYYSPDPYRSSDHDPVLVGLDLSAGGGGSR